MTTLVLGATVERAGDVTKNRFVGARCARDVERSLGFAPGRLARGWAVLVLLDQLSPADFIFSGTTLRSGGRLGLPAESKEADLERKHVTAAMLEERSVSDYVAMQKSALATITPRGPDRIVKVVPVIAHDEDAAPKTQYPPGGGGLQWTLERRKRFLVAMTVSADEIATIPGYSAFIGASATFDGRARIARWLDQA